MVSTEYRDELLADLQQTYQIDVWATNWDALDDDTAAHLAALTYQLPRDGRVWATVAPASAHSTETLLLREIEHNQRLWHWAHTEDAKNKSTEPQPITLTGEDEAYQARVEREEQNALEVAEAFGIRL